ncbi:MAG: TolC family protein [Flavobacteriales bacterium]|nr:TolC family protein [Flavobacteriales bacterium]
MRNLLILTICTFMSFSALAQDANMMELSVEDAVKYAWDNSQKSKTAEIDVQQADKDVWIQAAKGLPQINGAVNFNNFLQLPTSVFDASAFNPAAPPGQLAELKFGQPYTMDVGATASLMLFDGSYIIGIKGAKGFQKLSRDMQKMTKNEVKTIVGEAYYTSQIAKENVRLLNENISNMEKTIEETRALYKEGFTEEMNVEQLELLMNQMKNRAKQADRQHQATLNLLKYKMGMPIDTKINLSDDLETLWTLQSNEELMATELDLNANLAYDLIKQDIVMHGYLVKLETAKYLPRLSTFFDYKQQAFRDKFDFFDSSKSWYPQTLWGVKLSVPIWDNLGGLASINKAKLQQQKIKNKLADTEQALKLQAVTAKDDFASALEQLITSQENIELAKRIKGKTLTKYNEGLSTSMELTTAENQLLQAQGEYINTLFAAMNAKLQMKIVLENN